MIIGLDGKEVILVDRHTSTICILGNNLLVIVVPLKHSGVLEVDECGGIPPSPAKGSSTTFSGKSALPYTALVEWNAATVIDSDRRRRTQGASTPLILRRHSLRVAPSTNLQYSPQPL